MSNIEEDIKVLKNIGKLRRIEFKHYITDREEQAIRNILAERDTDKKRIEELRKENRKLRIVRNETSYGYENINFITEDRLVSIDKNKYFIEIEEGKFVDLKQVYLDNQNSISKQKVKDKIEKIEYYFDRLNVPDEDIEFIREVKKELLEDK